MNWSDRKKWWMDLLKGLLVFGAVAVVAVLWLDQRAIERERIRFDQQGRWAVEFEKKDQALRRFNLESAQYLNATDGAFLVACNGTAQLATHARYENRYAAADDRLTSYGQHLLTQWRGERWSQFEASLTDLHGAFSHVQKVDEHVEAMRSLVIEIKAAFNGLRKDRSLGRPCDWAEVRSASNYEDLQQRFVVLRQALSDAAALWVARPAGRGHG